MAGVVAFVNGADGNADDLMSGARGLDEHLGLGLEARGRKP